MAAAVAAEFDLALEAAPRFSVPGRVPAWPWRAPGGADRAGPGADARRLYAPGPLHEACRRGDVAAVAAALDAGADVDARDEARFRLRQRCEPQRSLRLHRRAGTRCSTSPPASSSCPSRRCSCSAARRWSCATRRVAAPRSASRDGSLSRPLLTRNAPPTQWGKAPVDWALQAEACAAVELLQRAAVARGVGAGRGEVAPLATCTEHHHGCTTAEMREQIAALTAAATGRQAATEKAERARGDAGTEAVSLPYDADSVRARLAAVRAAATAQVAPHRL